MGPILVWPDRSRGPGGTTNDGDGSTTTTRVRQVAAEPAAAVYLES